jgi:hypothetical protein
MSGGRRRPVPSVRGVWALEKVTAAPEAGGALVVSGPARPSSPTILIVVTAWLTVDLAIFTLRDDQLMVLLVERGLEPFHGMSAMPGGYVQIRTAPVGTPPPSDALTSYSDEWTPWPGLPRSGNGARAPRS